MCSRAGLALGFLALGLWALSAKAADLAYGEYLAGECVACHRAGADAAIPPIHTMPTADFIQALHDYRDGKRDHELMRTVARSLGDEEMAALAAYFEQLEE